MEGWQTARGSVPLTACLGVVITPHLRKLSEVLLDRLLYPENLVTTLG